MILTSSSAGLRGQPFLNPYVAAKHGVVGFMPAFAQELLELGGKSALIVTDDAHPIWPLPCRGLYPRDQACA
jgi:NAD(P)-dependent dehydrogenase (short-subunit alcohol dehydrogenase family)